MGEGWRGRVGRGALGFLGVGVRWSSSSMSVLRLVLFSSTVVDDIMVILFW